MKSLLKIIFKIVAGGFGAVFFFLCWNALKDVVFFASQGMSCEDWFTIPVQVLLWLLIIPAWNDWAFLSFAFGSLFILIIQLRPLLSRYIQRYVKQLLIILQVILLLLTGLGVRFEIQNELAIQKTYSEFCQAAKDSKYQLAYSYFSQEYRSKTGVNRFAKEIIDSSSYTDGCEGEFGGTIHHRWNGAFLYPYRGSNSACYFWVEGPELVLVRVDGKWYFTGEHHWYSD